MAALIPDERKIILPFIRTRQAISRTTAATYEVIEPLLLQFQIGLFKEFLGIWDVLSNYLKILHSRSLFPDCPQVDSVPSGGSEAIARRQDHRPAQDWRQVRAHRRVGRSDRRRQQQGGGRQQRLVDGVLGGRRIVAATTAVATAAAGVVATDSAVAADVVVVRSLKTCDSSS